MRWFLTNRHPIADALTAAGETVISTPERHQLAVYDYLDDAIDGMDPAGWWVGSGAMVDPFTRALAQVPFDEHECDPAFYDIAGHLRALDPDVLCITPMLQRGLGISKGAVLRWANRSKRLIVGVGHDPGTLDAARANRWRGCSVNIHNLHIYVTGDADAAGASARARRTVLWRPGEPVDALLAVARSTRASRPYQAGRRAVPFHAGNLP